LLARLYDPTAGRILLDGVDLREYDVDGLRREIGVIFQGLHALRRNWPPKISDFGRIEALGDQDRIMRSAEKSLAAEVIAGLPEKITGQMPSAGA